jgi:hypothetical protein
MNVHRDAETLAALRGQLKPDGSPDVDAARYGQMFGHPSISENQDPAEIEPDELTSPAERPVRIPTLCRRRSK